MTNPSPSNPSRTPHPQANPAATPSLLKKFRGQHASIDSGLDSLQTGFSSVQKFLKDKPYVELGIGAVAGYFLAAALLPSKTSKSRVSR